MIELYQLCFHPHIHFIHPSPHPLRIFTFMLILLVVIFIFILVFFSPPILSLSKSISFIFHHSPSLSSFSFNHFILLHSLHPPLRFFFFHFAFRFIFSFISSLSPPSLSPSLFLHFIFNSSYTVFCVISAPGAFEIRI